MSLIHDKRCVTGSCDSLNSKHLVIVDIVEISVCVTIFSIWVLEEQFTGKSWAKKILSAPMYSLNLLRDVIVALFHEAYWAHV